MKQTLKKLFILILVMLAILVVGQEEDMALKITTTVSQDTIRIGDTVVLKIVIEGGPAYQLLRVEPNPKIGVFEIQQALPVEEKKLKGNRWQQTYGYVLSTFDVGEFEIPPFNVFYQGPDGKEKSAATQPMKIKVETVLKTAEEKIDVRDIKAPLTIAARHRLLYLIAAAAGLLIIVSGLAYYWRRQALVRSVQAEEELPLRPIEEIALEELDQLVASDLLAKNKIKLYYIRLSEIMRVYMGRRYSLPALDMTSFELLNALAERLSSDVWEKLDKFFEECDLVKFAKHKPSAHRPKEIIEEGREIVRVTTPEPVVAGHALMQKEN